MEDNKTKKIIITEEFLYNQSLFTNYIKEYYEMGNYQYNYFLKKYFELLEEKSELEEELNRLPVIILGLAYPKSYLMWEKNTQKNYTAMDIYKYYRENVEGCYIPTFMDKYRELESLIEDHELTKSIKIIEKHLQSMKEIETKKKINTFHFMDSKDPCFEILKLPKHRELIAIYEMNRLLLLKDVNNSENNNDKILRIKIILDSIEREFLKYIKYIPYKEDKSFEFPKMDIALLSDNQSSLILKLWIAICELSRLNYKINSFGPEEPSEYKEIPTLSNQRNLIYEYMVNLRALVEKDILSKNSPTINEFASKFLGLESLTSNSNNINKPESPLQGMLPILSQTTDKKGNTNYEYGLPEIELKPFNTTNDSLFNYSVERQITKLDTEKDFLNHINSPLLNQNPSIEIKKSVLINYLIPHNKFKPTEDLIIPEIDIQILTDPKASIEEKLIVSGCERNRIEAIRSNLWALKIPIAEGLEKYYKLINDYNVHLWITYKYCKGFSISPVLEFNVQDFDELLYNYQNNLSDFNNITGVSKKL